MPSMPATASFPPIVTRSRTYACDTKPGRAGMRAGRHQMRHQVAWRGDVRACHSLQPPATCTACRAMPANLTLPNHHRIYHLPPTTGHHDIPGYAHHKQRTVVQVRVQYSATACSACVQHYATACSARVQHYATACM